MTIGAAIKLPRGPQGYQGTDGSQGYQGTQGIAGAQGGTQGSQGADGAQGTGGAQGAQGADGSQGSQGSQGYEGIQGAAGSQDGAQGAQGADGAQGSQGSGGSQGAQGSDGAQGYQGTAGGIPVGLPLHWEFPLLSSTISVTGAAQLRLACREIDLSEFPLTYNSLNLQVFLHATLETTIDTATLELIDITVGTPVSVALLTTVETSPTPLVSPPITVSNTNGSIYISPVHLYELDISVSGSGTATCSEAWLIIKYT